MSEIVVVFPINDAISVSRRYGLLASDDIKQMILGVIGAENDASFAYEDFRQN